MVSFLSHIASILNERGLTCGAVYPYISSSFCFQSNLRYGLTKIVWNVKVVNRLHYPSKENPLKKTWRCSPDAALFRCFPGQGPGSHEVTISLGFARDGHKIQWLRNNGQRNKDEQSLSSQWGSLERPAEPYHSISLLHGNQKSAVVVVWPSVI